MNDIPTSTPAGETAEPESVRYYLHVKEVFGGRTVTQAARAARRARAKEPVEGATVPYGSGREPSGIGGVVDGLTAQLGWDSVLARSGILAAWPELVGPDVAEHTDPLSIDERVMTVRCDSTAWATQLRLMRADLITRIAERFPLAGLESIHFSGPDAPSWKRGPRSIPGRGPRDTYG